MTSFRVGLSRAFFRQDGTPTYPDFDLSRLERHPPIELVKVDSGREILADHIRDLDALILGGETFSRSAIAPDSRLTLVARFGVGYDAVDVGACAEHGIGVAITPDGVRRPVAVSVIALLLALTGRMFDKDRITRLGPAGFAQRSAFMGVGLIDRTLGLVGLGNIGLETVKLAQPFGLRFLAHDPYVDPAVAADLNVALADLDTVFRESDFVSLNCPLTPKTAHLVDKRRLGLMKPSSFLINTARGGLIDQVALTRALRAHRIAGAGLDVLDPEPPTADDPILKLDNVILAPHALAHTDQCFASIGASDVNAVLAVMSGQPPLALVDRSVLEHPAWRTKLANYGRRFNSPIVSQGR
jgi:phosphoglycerate dehydrogenase-like enzyme